VSVPSNDLTIPGVEAFGAVTAQPAPASTDQGAPPRRWSAALPLLLVGLGGGLGVGAVWVVLAPVVARWAGPVEDTAARDVTFGLLGVLAGLVTAGALLVWPGSRPALHAGLLLGAATGASLLAWGTGVLLGAQPLRAIALVVVWPLVAAAMTVVRSLVVVLLSPT
jgi:hypothetical protein